MKLILSLLAAIATGFLTAIPAQADDSSAAVSHEWRALIEQLAPLGEKTAALVPGDHDPQWRADMYEFLYSQIALGYMARAYNDPKYPKFSPMYNHLFNQGFPNPDDSYYLTPIDDDGVYKISGYRGKVRLVYFQVGSGTFVPYGSGNAGPSKSVFDIDTLKIAKDGAFSVVLSPTRPAGHKGDWWKLEAGATHIVVRQRSYDWLDEDGRFAIERLDLPAARPRPSPEQIDAKLKQIAEFAESYAKFSLVGPWVNHLRSDGLVNKLAPRDYSAASGLGKQAYVEGLFELNNDEALVIETELPKSCRYWNFQLTDEFWRSIDWVHRQSILNGFTARLDRDGKFRAVVSMKDPGVPNWLDTVDHKAGMIYGRWTDCSSTPTPTVTKVKLAEVRKYLPADTPSISPEQREATIRQRGRAWQLRRHW